MVWNKTTKARRDNEPDIHKETARDIINWVLAQDDLTTAQKDELIRMLSSQPGRPR